MSSAAKRGGGAVEEPHPSKRLRVDEDLHPPLSDFPIPGLPQLTPPAMSSAAAAVAAAAAAAAASGGRPPPPLTSSANVAAHVDSFSKQMDQSEANLRLLKQRSTRAGAADDGSQEAAGLSASQPGATKEEEMKDVDVAQPVDAAASAASAASASAPAPDAVKPEGAAAVPPGPPGMAPPSLPLPPAPKIIIPISTVRIVCSVAGCTSKFTSEKGLSRHMSKHAVDKKPSPHVCDECKGTFATKANLKVHMRIHTGEKPFKCETCTKAFRQLSGLEGHKKIHTGEKPYQCERCGRCFAQKGTLHQHVLSHTGEKPHICDTCNRGFTQLSTLLQHKRTHTGARPFVCKHEGCGKARLI